MDCMLYPSDVGLRVMGYVSHPLACGYMSSVLRLSHYSKVTTTCYVLSEWGPLAADASRYQRLSTRDNCVSY